MAAGASGEGRGNDEARGREGESREAGRDLDRQEPYGVAHDCRGHDAGHGGSERVERSGLSNVVAGGPVDDGNRLPWLAAPPGSHVNNTRPGQAPSRDGYRLQAPATAAEWDAYYLIREDVFLEGEVGFKRSDEDEDRLPGHFPLLLWNNDEPVGGIRLDVLGGGRAALRLVAIHPSCQARGHGARMLQLAEGFARALECGTAVVYSTLEAAGFYARAGYAEDPWDDCCIGGIVQMSKPL